VECAAWCDIHSMLAGMEECLETINDHFVAGWRIRKENELLIESWEHEEERWKLLDKQSR
jgi:hypothetical protein